MVGQTRSNDSSELHDRRPLGAFKANSAAADQEQKLVGTKAAISIRIALDATIERFAWAFTDFDSRFELRNRSYPDTSLKITATGALLVSRAEESLVLQQLHRNRVHAVCWDLLDGSRLRQVSATVWAEQASGDVGCFDLPLSPWLTSQLAQFAKKGDLFESWRAKLTSIQKDRLVGLVLLGRAIKSPPPFTTDEQALRQVTQAVLPDYTISPPILCPNSGDDVIYEIAVLSKVGSQVVAVARAVSVPEATCIALLRAYGVAVSQERQHGAGTSVSKSIKLVWPIFTKSPCATIIPADELHRAEHSEWEKQKILSKLPPALQTAYGVAAESPLVHGFWHAHLSPKDTRSTHYLSFAKPRWPLCCGKISFDFRATIEKRSVGCSWCRMLLKLLDR